MTFSVFLAAALLVAAGGLVARRRIRRAGRSALTDDDLRRIEEGGQLEFDEPLDLDEARAAEEAFLEETWDQPDEDIF